MSDTSKIQWTDATWNPTRGCSLVNAGCENCYAMKQAHRFSGPGKPYEGLTKLTSRGPVWTGEVRTVPKLLDWPLRKRKPLRIFVDSMSDLFHEAVPFEFIADVFHTMTGECDYRPAPEHVYQILTKRPHRMREFFEWLEGYSDGEPYIDALQELYRYPPYFPRIWLGYSASTQEDLEAGIGDLLETPAAVRFLSLEPLLEPINLREWIGCAACGLMSRHLDKNNTERCNLCGCQIYGIDWVIVGGESGPRARPCNIEWIRSIVQECMAAEVAVFVKQLGSRLLGDFRYFPNADGSPGNGAGSLPRCGNGYGCRTRHSPTGADPTEWPTDLRVREMPKASK